MLVRDEREGEDEVDQGGRGAHRAARDEDRGGYRPECQAGVRDARARGGGSQEPGGLGQGHVDPREGAGRLQRGGKGAPGGNHGAQVCRHRAVEAPRRQPAADRLPHAGERAGGAAGRFAQVRLDAGRLRRCRAAGGQEAGRRAAVGRRRGQRPGQEAPGGPGRRRSSGGPTSEPRREVPVSFREEGKRLRAVRCRPHRWVVLAAVQHHLRHSPVHEGRVRVEPQPDAEGRAEGKGSLPGALQGEDRADRRRQGEAGQHGERVRGK
mmetsp:Transcript_89488/g.253222  ORF Transcript_89488/g.253222 Transcript_89488/m.253222 type:complete len:266 (-) Transcript_89488:1318-2115(-)